MSASPEPSSRGWFSGLTRNVFVLGAVSLFTDISSEMIVPVRILFLIGVLHTPLAIAGLIEGVAESTASLVKIFSGRLADRVARRKPLIVAGYSLSNLFRPLLGLVSSWSMALGLIFVDRVGKGVRGSPRDALLADSTSAAYRGKAFGFHRSMDTLGAAIGPLLTFAILALSNNNLRLVFICTAVPGVLSILILLFFLREPKQNRAVIKPPAPASQPTASVKNSRWQEITSLGPRFWMFTTIATVFALGNASDAFIFLRTEGLENALEAVPLIYFGYNIVYALLATPLGVLSDRWGRLPVLLAGYLAFGLVYLGWARASQSWQPWVLFLLYGVYAAATEGVSKAFIADLIPKERRGTALGWFNGLTGLAALPANLLAGWLWANFGPGAPFVIGASLAFMAAALMQVWSPWLLGKRKFVQEKVIASDAER